MARRKSFEGGNIREISPQLLLEAENLLVEDAQKDLKIEVEKTDRRQSPFKGRAHLKQAPPFTYTMLELFGPYAVRGEVQLETGSGKAYGVIFTDRVSRAVHIEAVYGYDKPSFLLALSRFATTSFPGSFLGQNGKDPGTAGHVTLNLDYIAFLSCLEFAVLNSVYHDIILRPKQVICLEGILLQNDELCVLPTGYGKSDFPSYAYVVICKERNRQRYIPFLEV